MVCYHTHFGHRKTHLRGARLARETISRLEHGHHLRGVEALQALAAALEVGAEELLRAEALAGEVLPVEASHSGGLAAREEGAGRSHSPRDVRKLAARLDSLPVAARGQTLKVFNRVLDLIGARAEEVSPAPADAALAGQVERLVRLLDGLPEERRAYWEQAIQAEASALARAASPPG